MSSASMNAEITLKATGAGEVVASFDKLKKSSADIGKNTENIAKSTDKAKKETKGFGDAFKDIEQKTKEQKEHTAFMVNLAQKSLPIFAAIGREMAEQVQAVDPHRSMNYKEAADRRAAIEESATRLSLRASENYETLLGKAEAVSAGIGESQEQILRSATAFTDLTYSASGSVDVMETLGRAANESGRRLEQMVPVAAALATAFGSSNKEMEDALALIGKISKVTGNQGGSKAFQDIVASVSPQLGHVNLEGKNKERTLAFVAQLGKGLAPAQAKEVTGRALSWLTSLDPAVAKQVVGYDPYDDRGRIKDLPKFAQDIIKRDKKNWKGQAGLAYMRTLGPMAGKALYNVDFKESELNANGERSLTPAESGLQNFLQSEAGQEIISGVKGIQNSEGYKMLSPFISPIIEAFTSNEKGDFLTTKSGARTADAIRQENAGLRVGATELEVKDYQIKKGNVERANRKNLSESERHMAEENDKLDAVEGSFKRTVATPFRALGSLNSEWELDAANNKSTWWGGTLWNKAVRSGMTDEQINVARGGNGGVEQKALLESVKQLNSTMNALPKNMVEGLKNSNFYVKQPASSVEKTPGNVQSSPTR